MKRYMYLLSIVSCSILSYLFISRGQYLPAAFVATVAILYTAGIIIDALRKRKQKSEKKAEQNILAQEVPVDTTITELLELLKRYTKNMRIFRNAAITLALIAIMVVFVNESLAITIVVVALLPLFKFYQNYRAVRLIKKGLAEHID